VTEKWRKKAGVDVEERLLLAAASLRRDASGFDGEAFSDRLYRSLGISPDEVEAARAGDGVTVPGSAAVKR
jgi:hypothetical protein